MPAGPEAGPDGAGSRGTSAYIRSMATSGRPGLPRGRTSLPPEQVRHAQRGQLVHAITDAVMRRGYAEVTVADVVAAARVSRTSFYAQFADREDCLLAAATDAHRAWFARISAAVEVLAPAADEVAVLRAGLRAYLGYLGEQPAAAVLLHRELVASGRRGADRVADARRKLAARTAVWHARARTRHPDWPQVAPEVYRALTGAMEELVGEQVRAGRTAELPALEHTLVDLHIRLLTA
jgi:AcrR family transcriptional regulator